MDKIIDRLSDIEKAAGSLMDDAGVRKKALAKEMEEKTAAFDRELEQKQLRAFHASRSRWSRRCRRNWISRPLMPGA